MADEIQAMSETTFMVLCPASREWATTKTWLGGTLEALKHFEETSQERLDMEGRITNLLERSTKPSWGDTIENYNRFGPPANDQFNKTRPQFVSVQGQHRAALLNYAFASDLGLSLSRGGDLDGGLFTDAERPAKMSTLKERLRDINISVNVHDFLTHDDAETVGRRQRTVEATTTDVSFLDVSTSQGLLVKQLFNPEDDICQDRVMEAFGDDWRSTLKNPNKRKDAENIKKSLVDRIKTAMKLQLGLNSQRRGIFSVFVHTWALQPERPSIEILRRYFEDQNAKVIKAKAAKVKLVAGKGKHSTRAGRDEPDDASATEYTPHGISVTAMGALFSLTAYSQASTLVQDMLYKGGLSEDFRIACFHHCTVLEVVRAMVTGLLSRRHCSPDPTPYDTGKGPPTIPAELRCLYNLLHTFVSEEEAQAFSEECEAVSGEGEGEAVSGKGEGEAVSGEGEGEDFIHSIYQEVDLWVPPLVRFALKLKDKPVLTGEFKANKLALTASLFRRVNAFQSSNAGGTNPSNNNNLPPGWGKKPHMSTSGSEPDYTTRTWDDWFTYKPHEKDGQYCARFLHNTMATVFGLLIVDRILGALRSKHNLPSNKFRELVRAIPEVGEIATLKGLLQKPKTVKRGLQVGEESFFDEERLALLAQRESSNDGSGDDSDIRLEKPFAVTVIDDEEDDKLSSMRWTTEIVQQLGLLGDDGELTCSEGVLRFTIAKDATRDLSKKRKASTSADIRQGDETKRPKKTNRPASDTKDDEDNTSEDRGSPSSGESSEEKEDDERLADNADDGGSCAREEVGVDEEIDHPGAKHGGGEQSEPSGGQSSKPDAETCADRRLGDDHVARVMNAVRKAKEECTHNVGGLVEFFKVECAHFFHSVWAASKGTGAGQILYIFWPPNLDVPQGKDLPAEWLDDDGKAAAAVLPLLHAL
ncbi:expressed unknown protein [Ectocarpus siliculosus]|uniref:Uncharacterized protein n=1 Tax=Ectocarpus siliculosus TaxID=2880 RepID=D7G2U1_ECTSI|nr:expressed unknown protein [Ectocarpus siliculosus]|eukprot:CBJ33445.1 expressed unknown protein [Ectocarpus siliculosus]